MPSSTNEPQDAALFPAGQEGEREAGRAGMPVEPEISQEAARAMLAALRIVQTGLALMHHGQGGEWFAGCPVRSVSKALQHIRGLDKQARAAIAIVERAS